VSKYLKNTKPVSGHVTYDVIYFEILQKYVKSLGQPICDFSGKNNQAKWSKRLKNGKSASGHVTYDVIINKIWSKYLKSVNQPTYEF